MEFELFLIWVLRIPEKDSCVVLSVNIELKISNVIDEGDEALVSFI